MAGTFRTVFGDAIRVLRTLVHEVLGAFFIALAVIGGSSAVQEYQTYSNAPGTGVWRITLAVIFSAGMLGFGLHSFWKARRIQK
jgi:hypothetical protein